MFGDSTARRLAASCSGLALAALIGLGCGEDAPTEPGLDTREGDETELSREGAPGQQDPEVRGQLLELRQATAPFQRFERAQDAGYTVLVTHPVTGAACIEHPTDGAMGRHYLNPGLVDDAVAVTEPEAVIYEPQANGKLQLVGFEYLIPYAIRGSEETPPTLFGQHFLPNPTFGVWMHHVWLWKHNPSGMFATWNPRVTCEHDDAVEN